ncbi:MAG TPA: TetR family transcriptional regulator [Rhizomicrobium sp.]|jgi:AcrR family transcriptional regulator|nr:TetR family transcriptional regulator [Rhizomicrobium sp.]
MSLVDEKRAARRAREHKLSRTAILEAARRVAVRDGAEHFSLRGVAAEAGFAPAALYGYFRDKDELLLALAADDLSALARALRDAPDGDLTAALSDAMEILQGAESLAAATAALSGSGLGGEAERLFNGRLITALTALSDAASLPAASRESQADVVLMAGALAGLAVLVRSGRLAALGFAPSEILGRLAARFSPGQ